LVYAGTFDTVSGAVASESDGTTNTVSTLLEELDGGPWNGIQNVVAEPPELPELLEEPELLDEVAPPEDDELLVPEEEPLEEDPLLEELELLDDVTPPEEDELLEEEPLDEELLEELEDEEEDEPPEEELLDTAGVLEEPPPQATSEHDSNTRLRIGQPLNAEVEPDLVSELIVLRISQIGSLVAAPNSADGSVMRLSTR